MATTALQITNVSRQVSLATRASRADTFWTRLVGLLGRARLETGQGLHILPCSSVHTCFMRFPIDVLYLDAEQRVVRSVGAMRPFRYSWGRFGARSVVELPAGTLAATATNIGDQLGFEEV